MCVNAEAPRITAVSSQVLEGLYRPYCSSKEYKYVYMYMYSTFRGFTLYNDTISQSILKLVTHHSSSIE